MSFWVQDESTIATLDAAELLSASPVLGDAAFCAQGVSDYELVQTCNGTSSSRFHNHHRLNRCFTSCAGLQLVTSAVLAPQQGHAAEPAVMTAVQQPDAGTFAILSAHLHDCQPYDVAVPAARWTDGMSTLPTAEAQQLFRQSICHMLQLC